MKKSIIAIIFSIAGVAAWAYSHSGADEASGYRFVTVERGDLESVVSSTGTLDAVTTVEVGTQVSGRIAEILVDYNDQVEKGQVIARIDSTLLELAVREAEANLERLEAQHAAGRARVRALEQALRTTRSSPKSTSIRPSTNWTSPTHR